MTTTDTRTLQLLAAAAAAAAAVALLVDDDGTVLAAIAFAAVAGVWWFVPALVLRDRPSRATVVRWAAMSSIAVTVVLLVLLVLT